MPTAAAQRRKEMARRRALNPPVENLGTALSFDEIKKKQQATMAPSELLPVPSQKFLQITIREEAVGRH